MPGSPDAALAWLRPRQAEMEALLRDLVEISSHTADPDGVGRLAARYRDALSALGGHALRVDLHPGGRFGPHLSARSSAGERERAVLLIGHHDTVFPAAAFRGYREDGPLLRGPGVLDMKGGLVVMAYALGALAEAGLLSRIPVRLVSVSDEEVGSPEGRHLLAALAPGCAAALTFESGRQEDRIITRRKGTGGLTVTARGRAAHAGNLHHEGANAIWALARFVDRAQALTDYDRGVTVNVGRIEGGLGKNTVPDHALAQLDFRYIDRADGEAALRALHEAAAAAQASVPGTTLEAQGGIQRPPLERTEASARLAAAYGLCARAEGLGADESPLLGGGSDASTISVLGIPAIDGLGPRGRGFHTLDEQVERASLVPKTAALVRFLVEQVG
jgi:glutamate carboxypeptidase